MCGDIEEVVVTGSFIRRDTINVTTPVQVMTEEDLLEQGTPNLGEVLRNSTFNYGVQSVSNILSAQAQSAGTQGANFRGLGSRATLTLLNGRRTLNTLPADYDRTHRQPDSWRRDYLRY